MSGLATYKGHFDIRALDYMLKAYPGWSIKLRNALHLAKRDGLLQSVNSNNISKIVPTKSGLERLSSLLPRLKRQAKWSGSLWLVTYDIAEDHKKDREVLRRFLLDQGYGKLQDSVYVAPFDPTDEVRRAVNHLSIQGEVLISRMGENGHIGEMPVQTLIERVYPIAFIDRRYQRYIASLSGDPSPERVPFLFLEFLSILKDDPQLPLALLPSDWSGWKAYVRTTQSILPHLLKDNTTASYVLERLSFSL